jgi:hypothetical protein
MELRRERGRRLTPLFPEDRPDDLVEVPAIALERAAQDAFLKRPDLAVALPRPFDAIDRASRRSTPMTPNEKSMTAFAVSRNTPLPQNGAAIANPHSAERNSDSSCRT